MDTAKLIAKLCIQARKNVSVNPRFIAESTKDIEIDIANDTSREKTTLAFDLLNIIFNTPAKKH